MEITIKTKFDIKDTPFGFYNGGIFQFKIKHIKITYDIWDNQGAEPYIEYQCEAIPPKGENWDMTFNNTFLEHELLTLEELKKVCHSVMEYQE